MNRCWSWSSNTLATWCGEQTHWKRPWSWETLRAGGEGGERGWDGWMASPTQCTWVWANSGRKWRTGKPGVLQSTGVAKSRTWLSDWATATTLRLLATHGSLDPGAFCWHPFPELRITVHVGALSIFREQTESSPFHFYQQRTAGRGRVCCFRMKWYEGGCSCRSF